MLHLEESGKFKPVYNETVTKFRYDIAGHFGGIVHEPLTGFQIKSISGKQFMGY